MTDPMLPVLEVEEALSVLRGRLDVRIFSEIQDFASAYARVVTRKDISGGGGPQPFPAASILACLHQVYYYANTSH